MRITSVFTAACLIALGIRDVVPAAETGEKAVTLFNFSKDAKIEKFKTSDAKLEIVPGKEGSVLRVRTGHAKPWPGVTMKAPEGRWDLSGCDRISFDVTNSGEKRVTVFCRVDNPGGNGAKNCVTSSVDIPPGEMRILVVRISGLVRLTPPREIIGMRGVPADGVIDTSNIIQLIVFVNHPAEDYCFDIAAIQARGRVREFRSDKFFPFIDKFGQYIHKNWPGKTHSLKELRDARESEKKKLAAQPGPSGRDKYGGWKSGQSLEATGFFRVEKYKGKWWLVDPDGKLFWSHGVDCVTFHQWTPIRDREDYFRDLPEPGSDAAAFYSHSSWAPHGYYAKHHPFKTFDFFGANLARKYGSDWKEQFAEVTHRRLRSWGMNTIGNWSEPDIYRMHKTPYVCTVNIGSRRLEGSEGYWGKFYDVFAPDFSTKIRKNLRGRKSDSAGDPWCIGYFVDNELSWGNDVSLALATLQSPAKQPAKKVFIEDLKARYGDVKKLNAAWGSSYASWDALLLSRKPPDVEKARGDLEAFYTKTAETYFRTVREALKQVAPNQLYLGCRFAWVNDSAAAAAIKYCDVVSYNRYVYSVADFSLPGEADKPVIIGEFHFGALDRGKFHTGLRAADDQEQRAACYENYVRGALRNPLIVGTHWFQYPDQPTTGRGDGENYQIGLVDTCDRPYPETVAAVREVGDAMYEYRLKGK